MVLSACNITKVVPKNKQLLIANKIERGDSKGVDLSEETNNLRPLPNRELVGFIKFHLWAYQYGNKGFGIIKKQSKLRRLAEKIGEKPSFVDSNQISLSTRRLSDYYFSKGFLNNKVSFEVVPKKVLKKRAKVIYNVELNDFHKINSLEYNATSRDIEQIIKNNEAAKMLKVGQRLQFDIIENERNRITALLRDNGFYYFNSAYVDFQVDTNQNPFKADLLVNIRNKKNYEPHLQQSIEQVIVKIGKGEVTDTLDYNGLVFLEKGYFVKPLILSKNIVFRPGDLYNASRVQKTYSNLLGMGLFNFVTIKFRPSPTDSSEKIIAEIELQPAVRHVFIWEPQAIFSDQRTSVQVTENLNAGIVNNITFSTRNVFGGAESFNLSALTAFETQIASSGDNSFNNFRQSVTAEYILPSLVYFERKRFSEVFTRKSTKVDASFLFDRNINYTRKVFPLNFTYNFSKDNFFFGLTPFRISVNKADVDPDFLKLLDVNTQFYTTQLLTDNLIMGPTANFYWTNKKESPSAYWTVRSNPLELSGNVISFYFDLFSSNTGINKEVLNIKYAQYTRSDIDVSYNLRLNQYNAIAVKGYTGFGLPFGNSQFLPYERRFFVGGSNSLRAWRPRTIGPGSYSDSTSNIAVEKTGEIILQSNAEYRFTLINKYLEGALFLDIGNMWNFRENANFKNAEFRLNRFYKEFAINTGFGVRFDFDYFIFRMDWGIALHDPTYQENKRWVIKDFFSDKWLNNNTAFNFAVGYPF